MKENVERNHVKQKKGRNKNKNDDFLAEFFCGLK